MELLSDPQVWASFLTLCVMEIVLGIDNIVFISVVVSRLPEEQAKKARQIGLLLALVFRILLLLVLSWLIGLTAPVFTAFGQEVSWRDLILIGGGLFLIYKATHEIHAEIEHESAALTEAKTASFGGIIAQVLIIDMVFSVDSIITAIGMAEHVEVMIAAVIVAIAVMYAASGPIAEFIKHNPTTKMLALAFLLLIGVALIADGLGFHIPRGYIYFSMAFAAVVEVFNVLARRRRQKVAGDKQ
ncbi:putative tellurium resistance membrane protein TerC [Rhodopseudomonas julia]|uniref:Tellurium resistance membrane protein TerC n=1 Tax=Rhodopseudomonas julia TaxID=200617 RepID=A0ABU0C9D2_9BRAD|nr:TerC family protein [Rhodopseudomonas julia]MDQ0327121.1 putative tellurium resistance membrane protein TerC [Rhodopseudomonas julia]